MIWEKIYFTSEKKKPGEETQEKSVDGFGLLSSKLEKKVWSLSSMVLLYIAKVLTKCILASNSVFVVIGKIL